MAGTKGAPVDDLWVEDASLPTLKDRFFKEELYGEEPPSGYIKWVQDASSATIEREYYKRGVLGQLQDRNAAKLIQPGTNLNTLINPGTYVQPLNNQTSFELNYPVNAIGTTWAGYLEVLSSPINTSIVIQRYGTFSPSSHTTSERAFYGGVWGPWKPVQMSTYREGSLNTISGIDAAKYLTKDGRLPGETGGGGYEITAFGAGSFMENRRGWKSVGFGSFTGRDNVDGYYNVFIGNSAGERNIGGIEDGDKNQYDPGARNTYIGSNAGRYGLTGHANVLIGRNAGHSNLSGSYITAVGTNSHSGVVDGDIHSSKTADYVTALGWGSAFYADQPFITAIGVQALYQSINPGSYGGTAVGHKSLRNSEARENTAVGNESGMNVTSGRFTIALGARAVGSTSAAVTGNANIGLGVASLSALTSGQYNIGTGTESLAALSTGSFNSFYGHQSGIAAPPGLTNASALGAQANVQHDNSVAIGFQTATSAVNQVAIGGRTMAMLLPPVAPTNPAEGAVLWIRSVSGKRKLSIIFPTGSAIDIATEV